MRGPASQRAAIPWRAAIPRPGSHGNGVHRFNGVSHTIPEASSQRQRPTKYIALSSPIKEVGWGIRASRMNFAEFLPNYVNGSRSSASARRRRDCRLLSILVVQSGPGERIVSGESNQTRIGVTSSSQGDLVRVRSQILNLCGSLLDDRRSNALRLLLLLVCGRHAPGEHDAPSALAGWCFRRR